MSQDSAKKTEDQNAGSCKCTPVILLLFVGFVFGVITGFATKEPIMRTYLKVISQMAQEGDLTQPIDSGGAVTTVVIEDDVVVTTPEGEKKDEKKDEEKKEEEKKEGEEAKPADPAPAPAETPAAPAAG